MELIKREIRKKICNFEEKKMKEILQNSKYTRDLNTNESFKIINELETKRNGEQNFTEKIGDENMKYLNLNFVIQYDNDYVICQNLTATKGIYYQYRD